MEQAIQFRTAVLSDVPQLAEIERQCWPAELATSAETIAKRIETYASGQLVAVQSGEIVGAAYAQRITTARLSLQPVTYNSITDSGCFQSTHDDNGAIYELVSVGVLPSAKGHRLGRQLIDRQIQFAREQEQDGVARIVGFTRPVGFHKSDCVIEQHVELRKADGRLCDPVLSFHLDSGASMVSIHADFRRNDAESCGFGVLIEYPVACEPLSPEGSHIHSRRC